MFKIIVCLFCIFLCLIVFNLFFKKIEKFDNDNKDSIENDLSNIKEDTNKTSIIDNFYTEKPSEIFIDMFKFSEPWRNGLENDRNNETINT